MRSAWNKVIRRLASWLGVAISVRHEASPRRGLCRCRIRRMNRVSPAIVVCIVGALMMLYAGVSLATLPNARGGEAKPVLQKTRKAQTPPPVQGQDLGNPTVSASLSGDGYRKP